MEEKKDEKAVKIVSLEKAQKRIEKALSKAGIEHNPVQIHEALEILYAAHETDGVQPTREAFAECCKDQEAGRFIKETEKDPFAADNTKKIAAVIAAIVVVALAAGGAALWANQPTGAPQESTPVETPAPTPEAVASKIDATVKAEGADAESTKAKVEVLDSDGTAVVPAMDIPANQAFELGELSAGEYFLRVVQAPVNTDGSTYELPESATAFTVDDQGTPTAVEVELEKLDADDMSKEQLEATAKVLEENGKEDKAKAVQAKATTAPSKPGSAEQVKAEPTPAPSGNKNSSSSDQPAAHTHNWVVQTKTVHHDAQYKTVHHDAQYKTVHHDAVMEERYVCNGCEKSFVDSSSLSAHKKEAIKNKNSACTSSRVDTVTVQKAYDEKVLVKEAWSEKVLVKDAYDETVTTGYKCSGCGATK